MRITTKTLWMSLACLLPAVVLRSREPAPATQAAKGSDIWRPESAPQPDGDGFVLVRGGTFWSGDMVTRKGNLQLARVEDFEVLDHPLTNSEYAAAWF